ncbi:hypothetical protein [uncultured Jatrophihabitans sp.]|uniref:hypothetical protein n=1 Tax=uncultured Jatrophihabitans sp. TaxID=1610747 RepID=UPI0035C9485C
MNRLRMLVPLAGAAASALVLTACGSSGGGGSSAAASGGAQGGASSSAQSPTAASSSATSAPAPSRTQLQAINVQAADLPAGYQGKAATPDSDDDDVNAQLESCTGVQGAPESHKVATADSDDFTKGQLTVSSTFSSFQSQSDVDADVALIKSPKVNECLNTVFKATLAKSLGSSGTVDSATIKLTPGSGGGPSNVAALASGAVNITAGGQKTVIYLGVAFITGPQVGGTLSYVGIGEQLDTATQVSALAAVAKRAENP